MNTSETALSYTVIRETWLSQKPSSNARLITGASLLFLVLACSAYWTNSSNASEWMPATQLYVFEKKELWRLWTSLFAHADLNHLLSNSLMFYVLGYFLNGYFGSVIFPLLALFMGGVINAIILQTYAPEVQLIGISGVVYWMGGAWLALYALINTKISYVQRMVRSIGVMLALFFPSQAFEPNISYRAHFAGLALGLVCGGIYYLANKQKFLAAEITETISD